MSRVDGICRFCKQRVKQEKLTVKELTANPYDCIRLENQLCFPLYACAKEVVRQYRKPLETLDLTYTQYIVMMVFWEYGGMTEKELGEQVKLDSGTLAPLLRRLEKQGLVTRERPEGRENVLFIRLTERGEALKQQATGIPAVIKDCLGLTTEEGLSLRLLLNKAMKNMQSKEVMTNDQHCICVQDRACREDRENARLE